MVCGVNGVGSTHTREMRWKMTQTRENMWERREKGDKEGGRYIKTQDRSEIHIEKIYGF